MGKIYFPKSAKLIISMISSNEYIFGIYEEILEERFAQIDLKSNIQKFNFTNYYEEEFGKNLLQKLVSFESLIKIDTLAEIKRITNDLENDITDNSIASKFSGI